MDADRMRRVEELFLRATELPREERGPFLDDACGDDAELRREIETLLTADSSAGDFLERPAVEHGIDLDGLRRADDHRGERIGQYELLKKIGEGGMSEVYLAMRADDTFRKRVALKVIRHELDREDMLRRFRTERQILAGLDHPNIATLLDGGSTDDGLPYYVMDYVDGVPIDEYCDSHRLTVRERLELFRTVCAAVQYAHQNLVIHRDIKASNILVTENGVPILLDFGIAKLLKPDQFVEQVEHTATWVRPMTPRYASPEQVQGRPVTTASDVYSLGVLLYKLLTGHLPYRLDETRPRELDRLVVEQEPERPSLSVTRVETGPSLLTPEHEVTPETVGNARATPAAQLRRQLTGDLDNILLMALRKEPQRRYVSVEQFSEDLRRYLRELPVVARRDTLGYRSAKFLRRNWIGVGVAAGFLVLLAGFAATMAIQANRIALERDQASTERDRAEEALSFMKEIFAFSDPLSQSGEDVTAREILDRGAGRVREELDDQPRIQASLMDAIGNVYRNLGLYADARPLLEQALATRREVLDAPAIEIADSLLSLGVLETAAGEVDRAETLLQASLAMRRELVGPDDSSLGATMNHLGVALRLNGKFEEAEALYRDSIRILERGGDDLLELGNAKNNLGTLLINTGRIPEAEPLLREALEMRRAFYGERHPMVAQGLSNLGATLGMQGKFEDAEPVLREALGLYRELLEPDHPALVESLNNLGKLMQRMGDPRGAVPLYEEAIAIERARAGEGPKIAHLYANVGSAYLDMGDLDAAESFHRRSLDVRQQAHGAGHPDVARSQLALADVLTLDGRGASALAMARTGLETLESSLPEHWWTDNARSVLGGCLAAAGRYAEAESLLVDSHRALERAPGPSHPAYRAARRRLVVLYDASGRPDRAAAYR